MKNRDNLTKKVIMDTYISLLENKSYKKIKVREVADLVPVQRSTFYLYFENISDLHFSIEEEILGKMKFYISPNNYDPNNARPLDSVEAWFNYCKTNRIYLLALMGENGKPEFEKRFKDKICEEINIMMNEEKMPKDALRPFCVELTYSIHYSLMKFALQIDARGADIGFDSKELTRLSNYWRACAIKAENEKGILQT